jgi:hypothetical protein
LSEIEKEISDIKLMLEKIEGIIDSRLIGIEEPEDDEIEAIKKIRETQKSRRT